jgi:hypothetical protein
VLVTNDQCNRRVGVPGGVTVTVDVDVVVVGTVGVERKNGLGNGALVICPNEVLMSNNPGKPYVSA